MQRSSLLPAWVLTSLDCGKTGQLLQDDSATSIAPAYRAEDVPKVLVRLFMTLYTFRKSLRKMPKGGRKLWLGAALSPFPLPSEKRGKQGRGAFHLSPLPIAHLHLNTRTYAQLQYLPLREHDHGIAGFPGCPKNVLRKQGEYDSHGPAQDAAVSVGGLHRAVCRARAALFP